MVEWKGKRVEWKGKEEEELRWEQDGDRVRRHEKGVKNGVRGGGGIEVGIGLGWRRSDRGYGEREFEGGGEWGEKEKRGTGEEGGIEAAW